MGFCPFVCCDSVFPALLWIDPGLGQVDGMRLGAVKWLCASLLVLVPKGESQLGIVHNSGSVCCAAVQCAPSAVHQMKL